MRKCGKILLQSPEVWVPMGMATVFGIGMTLLNQLSWKDGASFILFQIAGILIPGMAVMLLGNWNGFSKMDFIALSYAIGYALNIVLYYLTVPFGFKGMMRYFVIALALAGLAVIVKKAEKLETYESDRKGLAICSIFIVILLVIETLTVCASNFFPPRVAENTIFNDLLYWIGNTITLNRSYPPISFRDYPQPYTYHYFSSMQMSVISLTTNMRPVILGLAFSFFQPIFLMVTAAYALFKRMSGKKLLIVGGMVLIFLTEGKVNWTNITHTLHLLVAQFGLDIGMGFYLLFFWMFAQQLQQEKFDKKLCVLTVVFFAMSLGSKAPYGAVAFCAGGIICLCWFLQKKFKKAFAYGIPILISFAVLYFFIINLGSSDQPETSLLQTFLNAEPYIYQISDFLRITHDNLLAAAGNNFLLQLLFGFIGILEALILSNYCIYIMFFYLLGMKVMRLRNWDIFDTACMTVIIIGTLITMNWGNPDASVAYFIMTTYIPATLFSVRTLDMLMKTDGFFTKGRALFLSVAAAALVLCGVVEAYGQNLGYANTVKKGWKNIVAFEERNVNKSDRAYISTDDFAAYEWIRCNTSEDALITANIGLQLGRNDTSRHSRIPGVFMERFVIRNDDTDTLFFDLDYEKLDTLRELGIEYISYNKTATEGFALPEEEGSVVYENATNVVYQLK